MLNINSCCHQSRIVRTNNTNSTTRFVNLGLESGFFRSGRITKKKIVNYYRIPFVLFVDRSRVVKSMLCNRAIYKLPKETTSNDTSTWILRMQWIKKLYFKLYIYNYIVFYKYYYNKFSELIKSSMPIEALEKQYWSTLNSF